MKLEFHRHVLTYAVVIAGLAVINLLTSPGYLWFLWPAAGWGIGLIAHAASSTSNAISCFKQPAA